MDVIKNFKDIQKLLLQFGTLIYTKDNETDIDMIEEELKELREHGLIDSEAYMNALLILKQRRRER
ncbi:MAG TPA: YqgQ family protein [Bacilli bacterium]|nr:YqgQ family protein [Bacilli bacterium]